MDIEEALADWQVVEVLEVWLDARMFEAPAFSGGVRDAWPSLMVDGLSICREEESFIDGYRRWLEAKEHPDG